MRNPRRSSPVRKWLTKALGDRGERAAARYLARVGYKIVTRKHKNRFGEIDLIALDGDCLVFVEVKTRRSDAAGLPVEAIDFKKRRKLTQVALAYLKRHHWLDRSARFDVVTILWPEGSRKPIVEHYRHAFFPVGTGQMFA